MGCLRALSRRKIVKQDYKNQYVSHHKKQWPASMIIKHRQD